MNNATYTALSSRLIVVKPELNGRAIRKATSISVPGTSKRISLRRSVRPSSGGAGDSLGTGTGALMLQGIEYIFD
jgi:hypothetical protein